MKKAIKNTVVLASVLVSQAVLAQLPQDFGKLDIKAAISTLPESSDKPFEDVHLVDNGTTGVRVFRVYNPVPRHNHAFSSTYLKIESGRAEFRLEGKTSFEAGEGDLIFWQQGVDHEVLRIIEEPLIFLAIDTPTRRADDVQKRFK